jgi:hypothetical protein
MRWRTTVTDIDTDAIRAGLRAASGDPDLWDTRAGDAISCALDEIDRLRARLAAVEALCDAAAPPGQCLYADEGVDCIPYCDCSWGNIWHESLRRVLRGEPAWPTTR